MKTEMILRWMSHEPITVTADTRLFDADNMMRKYNIRRLPVVDKNSKLVGIVTRGDIREASPSDANSLNMWELNYLLTKLKVKEIMTRNPITVHATDTITKAAYLMLINKISGLPVVTVVSVVMSLILKDELKRRR